MLQKGNLIQGGILKPLMLFTLPMLVGAFLQQAYNLTDTWMVGQYIGAEALAAVGSSYALMVFLVSIIYGLAMGSGTVISIHYGAGNGALLRRCIFISMMLIGLLALFVTVAMFLGLEQILYFLQVPADVHGLMSTYLWIVFWGIPWVCLYNFYAVLLRAVGDSLTPLYFLTLSVGLNVVLDAIFIIVLRWGIAGAAAATVVAQFVSAVGLAVYVFLRHPELKCTRRDLVYDREALKDILSFSTLTCVQQSVMNFGILLVQGLVNSFGSVVMAAFAVAVKIDSFAYMPVQEFGNAFSTFIAQNFGARQYTRIRKGMRIAFLLAISFSLFISVWVFGFAQELMLLFVPSSETGILQVGVQYLHIEGSFYAGIGILFLLYGYYRAIRLPGMSVVLTILSLGTRVALAYLLASIPSIGVAGIWWSIPIGWFIADAVGIVCIIRSMHLHQPYDEAESY